MIQGHRSEMAWVAPVTVTVSASPHASGWRQFGGVVDWVSSLTGLPSSSISQALPGALNKCGTAVRIAITLFEKGRFNFDLMFNRGAKKVSSAKTVVQVWWRDLCSEH